MGYSCSELLSCQKLGNFHLDPYIYDHIASAGIIKNGDLIFLCAPRHPRSEKHHKQMGSNANNLVTVQKIPSMNISTHQKPLTLVS